MEVIICKDTTEMGEIAARHIIAVLARSTHPVLGVATGSSPLSTYQALARLAKADMADFSNLSAFALDEYIGLSPDDERSYTATIKHTVTEQLGLDPANVHVPEGSARDLVAACQNYEKHWWQRPHRFQRTEFPVQLSHPCHDTRPAYP